MRHPLVDRIMKEMRSAVQINGELSLYDNGAEEVCNAQEFDAIFAELKKIPSSEVVEIMKEVYLIKYGDAFITALNDIIGEMDVEVEDPWADDVFDATEDILYGED